MPNSAIRPAKPDIGSSAPDVVPTLAAKGYGKGQAARPISYLVLARVLLGQIKGYFPFLGHTFFILLTAASKTNFVSILVDTIPRAATIFGVFYGFLAAATFKNF